MKKALVFAGAAEAATGLALLVVPSLVGQLLLGEELTGIAVGIHQGFGKIIERLVRSFSPMAQHQASNMLATSRKTAPSGLFARAVQCSIEPLNRSSSFL